MPDAPFPAGMMPCIEAFLANDKSRPAGKDFYQEVFDTPLFFPLQRQAELAKMMKIARQRNPKIVMEIGADKGGGVYHWCKCLPTVEKVIAFEIRGTPYSHLFEKAFPKIKFYWGTDSTDEKEGRIKLWDWLGSDKIDCLFIDGDKGKFLEDFDEHLPLMSENGVVFMHDINDAVGPPEAFEAVAKRGYKTSRTIILDDYFAAEKRQRDGKPVSSSHEGWLRHWGGRSCGVGTIYLGESK